MPANVKYLTDSKLQRFAKLSAGFLGGLAVSLALHLALGAWLGRSDVAITALFSAFLLWAGLFILAYVIENGWRAWAYYLVATVVLGLIASAGGATLAFTG